MRLKYWLQTAVQSSLLIVYGVAVYGAMMVLMGRTDSISNLLTMSALYLLIFGAGMGILLCITAWKLDLPVALGFGSTRKEAFWGMQCYRGIYSIVVLGFTMAMWLLAGEEAFWPTEVFLPIAVGILLIIEAMGVVLGVVGSKYGKAVMILISTLTVVLLIGGVFAGIIIAVIMSEIVSEAASWNCWLFAGVALVIYGLCLIPEYKTIFKYGVKL